MRKTFFPAAIFESFRFKTTAISFSVTRLSRYILFIYKFFKNQKNCITDVEKSVLSLVSHCLVGHHSVSYFLSDDVAKRSSHPLSTLHANFY